MIEKKLSYREYTELIIDRVNSIRYIEPTHDLNLKVKRVGVILCGSRNGSSLLKTIIAKSQDIAYLSGEEEPFYILTKNGFPYSSSSDSFYVINNKQQLLDNIFDDLGVNTQDLNFEYIIHQWKNRIVLQDLSVRFSDIFHKIKKIWDSLKSTSLSQYNYTYEDLNQLFIREFYHDKKNYGYYDIIKQKTPYLLNDLNKVKIEEPPFVIPAQKRPITEDDLSEKLLLFKTPQDCYRIGIFEQLFPNAEIKYIHLSRGFAQTVNGLMDGWLSNTGFFAHNMDIIGQRLNIKGYTDVVRGGDRWWKFDLPPNWYYYKNKSLEEVCLNQWYQAHKSILDSGVKTLRVKFEDYLLNPQETLDKITEYLNIGRIINNKPPIVMATEMPSNYRWHKRKEIIEKLSKDPKVIELMRSLDYSMDPKTWI